MSTSSIRTSRAEKNYFSISENIAEWFAGTEGVKPHDGAIPSALVPIVPSDWDAILKVSKSTGLYFNDLVVSQGRENVIDCNNGASFCSFAGDFGRKDDSSGDQVITVKGGSNNLTFIGSIHSPKPSRADIVIGAWADQSYEKSYNLDFSGVSRSNGEPVTVIVSWAHRDTIKLPSNCKELKLQSFLYTVYWYLKRVYVATIWKWFSKKN